MFEEIKTEKEFKIAFAKTIAETDYVQSLTHEERIACERVEIPWKTPKGKDTYATVLIPSFETMINEFTSIVLDFGIETNGTIKDESVSNIYGLTFHYDSEDRFFHGLSLFRLFAQGWLLVTYTEAFSD